MRTKYTDADLKAEIHAVLDALEAARQPLQPQWITHKICQQHREGLAADNAHAAFWEFAGYTTTRKLVTACINGRDNPVADTGSDDGSATPITPVLPGFEFLQTHYVMRRDGVDVGVPVMQCHDNELIARAALYRSQSAKLIAHADEIVRFVTWRAGHMAPAAGAGVGA